ncbi:odorant receptor Or2-like [Photinus pyralis]|uniref:odorant receptor Or2-like n=1 Tax=Photinus pyralis TaxID=7054 RepID=UPI0012670846|nr:odorant receptor Or2-like [Photinus pyralis]
MAEDQYELPEYYFKYQTGLLRLVGVELKDRDETPRYRIYSIITLICTLGYVIIETLELFYHDSFDAVTHVLDFVISHDLGMVKVLVVYKNRQAIGDLLRSLHEGVFKPNMERGGVFEKKSIHETYKRNHFLILAYSWIMTAGYGLAVATCIFVRITQRSEMWKMPFSLITIVDTSYTPAFEIAVVFQCWGVFLITVCTVGVDVLIVSIIAQISAQVKILENAIRTYIERGIKDAEKNNLTSEQSVHNTLRETIFSHHLTLLDTVSKVEDMCCYLILCIFVSNSTLLCLLLYKSSLYPLNSSFFIMFAIYYFVIALQVFNFCWWGNELTVANESLALGVSQSYSADEPTSHAMALKLMMIRTQRTLSLSAGKFAPLSLETYKALMKASFSYFMVLRQVNAEE